MADLDYYFKNLNPFNMNTTTCRSGAFHPQSVDFLFLNHNFQLNKVHEKYLQPKICLY